MAEAKDSESTRAYTSGVIQDMRPVALRTVLHQDRPLSEGNSISGEPDLAVLEMAYLRWKGSMETWALTTGRRGSPVDHSVRQSRSPTMRSGPNLAYKPSAALTRQFLTRSSPVSPGASFRACPQTVDPGSRVRSAWLAGALRSGSSLTIGRCGSPVFR